MSSAGRRAIAGVAVAAAVACGAVFARADGTSTRAAASGGLALSPALIERQAGAGPAGAITVVNHSTKRIDVTVAARPWVQSSSGAVSVNRAKTLPGVTLNAGSFALAAGASKVVNVTATSAASLYGAVEVIGVPSDAPSNGIVAGYRLVSSLRLNPAVPVLSLNAGAAKVTGTGAAKAIVLPLRNAGNTIQPVTGSVRLKGALGTRRRDLAAVRILPGRTVNVLLSNAGTLAAGSYTATVSLTQGGKTTTVTKTLRVKKG
jgi:hypothetical protein